MATLPFAPPPPPLSESDENQPACIRNISKEKSDVPRKSFLTSHMDTFFLLLTMRCVEWKGPLRGQAIPPRVIKIFSRKETFLDVTKA